MTDFFSYLLEVSLILIVLYTGFFFVLRNKAAPAFNRLYLLSGLFAAIIIPLIHLPLQGAASGAAPLVWQPAAQAWNFLPELVVYANKESGSQATGNGFNWLQLGAYLYLAGLLFTLVLSASRIGKLLKWLRHLPFRHAGDYSYLLAPTGGRFPTFSFLNYIFWDETAPLSQEEARQVLRHEEAHVKQGHSYDILLLELLTAFLWFNPVIYLYRHSVRQVHEHLADGYALQEGEHQVYLRLMVKQTLRQANLPLVSTFFQHNTLNRIHMIQTKPSKPLLRALFGLSLAATVFFVVACEDETEKLAEAPQQATSAAEHLATESNFEIARTQYPNKDIEPAILIFEDRQSILIKSHEVHYDLYNFKDTRTFKKAAEVANQLDLKSERLDSEIIYQFGEISGESLKIKYLNEPAKTSGFPETIEMPEEQVATDDQVFEVVEEQPRPAGGMEAFYKFVGKELHYPSEAKEQGIGGRVYVQFIVDEQGQVSEVKTVKGVGAGLDKEAERVIKLSKWDPGTQRGRPVKVRMIMPVMFKPN